MSVNIIKLFNCCKRKKSSSCSAEQAAKAAKAANGTLKIVRVLDILSQNIGLFLEPKEVLSLTETSSHFEEQSKFNGAIKIKENAPKEEIINLINKNKDHLEILDLSGNPNVDYKLLNELANSESLKKSLQELNLTLCYGVTDVSVLANLEKLHTLNLINCFRVTAVSALADCASLQELNLTRCSGVTAAMVEALKSSHPQLNIRS